MARATTVTTDMMNMSTAILTTTPTNGGIRGIIILMIFLLPTAELSAGVQVKFPGTIKIITHV
jgi:hypothetical protein